MKKQTISVLGKYGIVKDIDPSELAAEAWSDGNNVRCDNNTIESIMGHKTFNPEGIPAYIFITDQIIYPSTVASCQAGTLSFPGDFVTNNLFCDNTAFNCDQSGLFSGCTPTSYVLNGTLPAGVTFNTSSAVFGGTVSPGATGTYTGISIKANCGGTSCTSNAATITVVGV